MVARRSRRAQKKPPEVVPPKSDEEPNAEEGETNTAESLEDTDTDANTSSTPRRRQRGRKKTGSGVSENEKNSSDEGKSRENTDTGDSSDDEPLSSKAANQAKRARRQKKFAETDDAGKKTPKRSGRARKNADVESNDEDVSDADKETIRKSKRRTAGRRKQQDPSSGSDDESAKKVKRKIGRPRKNRDAEDSDSKMESAEDESSENVEESAKKVKRKIGRPRKNQDAEDSDSKMEGAEEESSENDDGSTTKPKRRRGRPRKNQDAEDSDSKVEAAEEESANEDESAKEPKRRRGRARKNQDAEDGDSKVEAFEKESANEDESAKEPKRRRGRPRKNQDAEDSDSKVETAEEDGDSSDDESSTAKSKGKPKFKPSKTAEDASSDESTSRPTRKRGRPKKASEVSSNDEGEQETQPNGTKKKATTRQTPDLSSIDEQSSDEEAPHQRRRPGRSPSPSTEETRSNEASEPTSRKRGRGRITPPVPSNDDEAGDTNQRTRVSKRRMEKIDETTPPDTVTPSDKISGREPTDTITDKPATGGETNTLTASKNKSEDESLFSKPEPQQEKGAKANPIDGANFKNANKGSLSKPEKQEKQETSNRSTAETSEHIHPVKMDCVPPTPPADTSGADTIDDAEVKDKASTNLCESRENISDSATESIVKQAEPISKKAEAKTSSKLVEEKESATKQSESSTTAEDGKVLHPGSSVPAAEKNKPSEGTTNSKVPDSPEKETAPEEKEIDADVVLTANSNDKAKCTGEGKKAEVSTKVDPFVPEPTARPSSESHEAVSLTNAPAEKKEAQGSEQTRPQLSVELNQRKPITENDAQIKSLEPTKEIEPNDAVKVQPSPPVSTTTQLKPQDQSLTKHEKTPKVELSDRVVASSVEVEKAGNAIIKDANSTSAMDVDSPVKDVKMTDVAESTPTPQEDPQMNAPAETSHAKESQSKPSEILQTAPITTPIDSEQETLPSLDTEPPSTAVATKIISSETVVIPTDSSGLHENSSAEAIDPKEAVASDEISECGESSPVTESSGDEEESDDEEDRPEPRFETKVLPFTSSSLLSSPSKEQNPLELLGNKVNRVKTMLYTIGSRVHRGRGFERIFAKYWDALTMRLSDRLSSHASRQCDAAIKTFLKSPKLRRIHNKLVVTLMKTSMKSFAPLKEIAEYIPEIWYEKVKQVDRVLIENEVKETKSQRKAREKRATRQQTTVYREAWASTQAAEENPISAVCLKTRCQEVDMRKIHASSASIPGALVIDPLVRDIAEQSSMRASENAIWLLIVAAREHASNLLKNTLKHKQDMECGEVSEPFLQYPKVIAGTKNALKKDTPADKTEQQPPAPVDYIPGKSQTRKVVTSFDVYASSLVAPTGPPASLGGSVSTTALELCLQNAYTSSSSLPGTDFYDVQKHIVEGITALAQDRKAMLLARGEEAKSNQVNIVNSQQQVVTNSRNVVNNSNVDGNGHGGVGAPPGMGIPVPVRGQAPQNEHNAPTTKPALAAQRKEIDIVPSKAPTTAAAAPLSTPADTGDAKSLGAIPGGLGRGAKDLASLMKRSPKPANPPVTSPITDGKDTIATESTVNSSPQKPAETSDVDELGTSTGSGRRGKGFGTKNLAALKARSTPEEKAARSESVPPTVVANEPQREEPPKASTKLTGASNFAALKGPAGAKDLAALRARSVAKASDAVGEKNEGTEQKSEAKPGNATTQKLDPKAPETSTKADAAMEASVSPNPSKMTDGKADPLKSADPANETKVDSATAPSPANNKKADIVDSNGNKSGDKDIKGGESDDKSVVVIERVKPPAKADKKDTSSSAGKGAVTTSGQFDGQKVEGKDTNATIDTQPKPALAPEKPKDSTAAVEADKSPNVASTDTKDSDLSNDTPATDESKPKSEAEEDGATLTSSPITTTGGPAASKDAPGVAPKGGEAANEAKKSVEGDTAGAAKSDETKVTEGNIAKPEGAKSDESGAANQRRQKTEVKGEPSK
ncbi:MAG: hypothetical protein SGBAC_004824 [Bacillariaceae sp.]